MSIKCGICGKICHKAGVFPVKQRSVKYVYEKRMYDKAIKREWYETVKASVGREIVSEKAMCQDCPMPESLMTDDGKIVRILLKRPKRKFDKKHKDDDTEQDENPRRGAKRGVD